MLTRRSLGNTGLQVSPYGIGTVKFGRTEQVKYPMSYELPSDREIMSLLDIAKDYGVNLIDTAPAYGSAQDRIGNLVKNSRSDWIYVSKVGEKFDGSSKFDFSRQATILTIQSTLRSLHTDYLDLVLIHSDGNDLDIIENTDIVDTLLMMKKAGFIRAIGMSTKTVAGGLKCIDLMDVIMVTLNLQDASNIPVIRCAKENNKGILIKKGLESGHVIKNSGIKESFTNIFEQRGVSSLIVGTIDPLHLESNLKLLSEILNSREI